MKNLISIVFYIVSWVLCFYTCVGAVLFKKSFEKDEIRTVFFFFLMLILILLRIFYLYFKKIDNNKEKILNTIFPLLYCLLIVFSNFNGYTDGNEKLGISYLIFKEHYYLGLIFYILMFAIVWITIALKTKIALGRLLIEWKFLKEFEKIILGIIIFIVPILAIINIIYFLVINKISNNLMTLLVSLPYTYWILYFCVYLIDLLKNLLQIDSNVD